MSKTLGVLLAGGLARRMGGGDKALRTLGGRPILDHVIKRAQPQVDKLILNANGDPARFQSYGLEVVADVVPGAQGPLAGILTALEYATTEGGYDWVASFATDAPFIPTDLVARLRHAIDVKGADMTCAITGERTHPVFALWPVRLTNALRTALIDEEMRKIDAWTGRYETLHVPFETTPIDPFFNINKPENLAEAEAFLRQSADELALAGGPS